MINGQTPFHLERSERSVQRTLVSHKSITPPRLQQPVEGVLHKPLGHADAASPTCAIYQTFMCGAGAPHFPGERMQFAWTITI